MNVTLSVLAAGDRKPVVDIFNHYVEHSFAAFPDRPMPYEFFVVLLEMCKGYPTVAARLEEGELVGFGMLRRYSPFPTLSRAAEVTYFLRPDVTGQGIGKAMLDYLVSKGRKKGVCTLLAEISSRNEGSLRFHLKNGFVECGRLRDVGIKHGQLFDVVVCQRML